MDPQASVDDRILTRLRAEFPRSGSLIGVACELGEAPTAECQVQVTTWCLPSDLAVRRARELLRSQLDGYVTDKVLLDDLDAIVCELAANARQHTHGPCEMRLLHHADVPVACEIADIGGGLDTVADHLRRSAEPTVIGSLTEWGRGLRIVAVLSEGHCGVRPTKLCSTGQIGKSVWFAIPPTRTATTHQRAAQ